jgi:hypothetical protein
MLESAARAFASAEYEFHRADLMQVAVAQTDGT